MAHGVFSWCLTATLSKVPFLLIGETVSKLFIDYSAICFPAFYGLSAFFYDGLYLGQKKSICQTKFFRLNYIHSALSAMGLVNFLSLSWRPSAYGRYLGRFGWTHLLFL